MSKRNSLRDQIRERYNIDDERQRKSYEIDLGILDFDFDFGEEIALNDFKSLTMSMLSKYDNREGNIYITVEYSYQDGPQFTVVERGEDLETDAEVIDRLIDQEQKQRKEEIKKEERRKLFLELKEEFKDG